MKALLVFLLLLNILEVSNGIFDEEVFISDYANANVLECSVDKNLDVGSSTCDYRGEWFPPLIYRWRSAYGCFIYIQPYLVKKDAKPMLTVCKYQDYSVPCFLKRINGSLECFPMDYEIPDSLEEVQKTVISDFVTERWKRCINSSLDCCSRQNALDTDPGLCPIEWDGWTCWPQGSPGMTLEEVCPEFAYSQIQPSCYHFSKKGCNSSGVWNSNTDYSSCSISPDLLARINFHVICLTCSLVTAVPALMILSSFKETKLVLHRNLLAAIVARNLLVILNKMLVIKEELVSVGPTTMSQNGGFCKTLAILEKFASQSVFSCMLMEGVFLHRKIVAVFKKDINMKFAYLVLIVITLIPVIIWIILMSTLNDSKCWLVYYYSGIQWTLNGPRLSILIINFLLYLDILKIFFVQMKKENSGNKLNTAKATLLLFPLFGLQFFSTIWYPETTNCKLEDSFFYFAYALDGLQGVIVAVLYCYLNKEVQKRVISWYQKTRRLLKTEIPIENRTRFRRAKKPNQNPRTFRSAAAQTNRNNSRFSFTSYRDSGVDITDINLDEEDFGSSRLPDILDSPNIVEASVDIERGIVKFTKRSKSVDEVKLNECFNLHIRSEKIYEDIGIRRRCVSVSIAEISRRDVRDSAVVKKSNSDISLDAEKIFADGKQGVGNITFVEDEN